MPAKSKTQKQLFAWAYACKNGKAKDCPEKVSKIGKSMSNKQLKDFFEGIIYHTKKTNSDLLKNFLVWMDSRHIEYIYDETTGELEIYNEFSLGQADNQMLLQYAAKLNLEKIWETGDYIIEDDIAVPGTTYANLGNTHGQGSVRPAAKTVSASTGVEIVGSGDKFDNFEDDDDDDEDKDKLKRKKQKRATDREKKKIKDETKENIKKQNGKKMERVFVDLETFLNEGVELMSERITAKRQYTEDHPSINVNYAAPIRNKVLGFIASKGEVSEQELNDFFKVLKEEIGKRPSSNWMHENKHLIKKHVTESGTTYKLTERGEKIHKNILEFEKK